MSKRIVLCDLDGTLADVNHRLHYIKNDDGTKKTRKESDWGSFHTECINDAPNEDVIEILNSLVRGWGSGCHMCGAVEREVYFLSGPKLLSGYKNMLPTMSIGARPAAHN